MVDPQVADQVDRAVLFLFGLYPRQERSPEVEEIGSSVPMKVLADWLEQHHRIGLTEEELWEVVRSRPLLHRSLKLDEANRRVVSRPRASRP